MAVVPLEEEAEGHKNVLLRRLKGILDEISQEERIPKKDILDLLKKEQQLVIPISIFSNRELGVLELVVKYLKEEHKYGFTEIAKLLKRDRRTVWTTYHFATKKLPAKLRMDASEGIPLAVFQDRGLGVLESLTVYLKEVRSMRYSQIARILNRDQRTIWTVYSRAKKKNGN
jgi:DNA-binding CsgD family transcriptional regulator